MVIGYRMFLSTGILLIAMSERMVSEASSLVYPKPEIFGFVAKYRINEMLNITCRSGKTRIPFRLRWLINSKDPQLPMRQRISEPQQDERTKLYETSIGLEMIIEENHFIDDAMRVTCLMEDIAGARSPLSTEKFATKSSALQGNNGNSMNSKRPSISVPASIVQGDSFWLNCTVPAGRTAHSIRWSKDGVDFYVYAMSDPTGPTTKNLVGLQVQANPDWEPGRVFVPTSTADTEGTFVCDINIDGYDKRSLEKKLKVMVLPSEAVIVEDIGTVYSMGCLISASCINGASRPEPILTWYINGRKVDPRYVRLQPPDHVGGDLYYTISHLEYPLNEENEVFPNATYRIKCESHLGDMFKQASPYYDILVLDEITYYNRFGTTVCTACSLQIAQTVVFASFLALLFVNGITDRW